MTDHLPECWKNLCETCDSDACPPCICTPLRACEQRVNSSNLTLWNRTKEEARHMIDAGLGIAWKDGFKEGLDAAREAVAGVKKFVEFPGQPVNYIHPDFFLAAIDALKEKP